MQASVRRHGATLPRRALYCVAVALSGAALSACNDLYGLCGNDVLLRVPSPTGRMDAVAFNRDCGATTGFSTQVSIVSAHAQPSDGGNVLVLRGQVPIKLRWESDASLVVSGIDAAPIVNSANAAGGVKVSCEK